MRNIREKEETTDESVPFILTEFHRDAQIKHTNCPETFLAPHCQGTNYYQRFKPIHVNCCELQFDAKDHLRLWKRACDNLKPRCQSTQPTPPGAALCKHAAFTLFNTAAIFLPSTSLCRRYVSNAGSYLVDVSVCISQLPLFSGSVSLISGNSNNLHFLEHYILDN